MRKEKTEKGNIVPTSENKACLCFYNECSRYSTKLKVLVIDRHALLPPITIRTPATTDFYPVGLTNAVIVGDSSLCFAIRRPPYQVNSYVCSQ